ncbi:MAG: hypothetical protein QM831_46480 [Kofleriaceae bacterium]
MRFVIAIVACALLVAMLGMPRVERRPACPMDCRDHVEVHMRGWPFAYSSREITHGDPDIEEAERFDLVAVLLDLVVLGLPLSFIAIASTFRRPARLRIARY